MKSSLFRFPLSLAAALCLSPALAQGELVDPPECTSREKDFARGAQPKQAPECTAPVAGGAHPELRVTFNAAARPVTIRRFGDNGAAVETFRVNGAYTYTEDKTHPGDGALLSPVLRPNVGDRLMFRLENNLPDVAGQPQVTNLHTHGFVVSPKGQSDNVFVLIYPNSAPSAPPMDGAIVAKGSFNYSVLIPADKIVMPRGKPAQSRAGLFWYHPHPHGVSQQQLARGLAGFIAPGAVEDYATCKNVSGRVVSCDSVKRHFIMLQDFTLKQDGADWSIVDREAGKGRYCEADLTGNCTDDPKKKWLFTTNGAVKPILRLGPGESRLLRLGNLGSDVTYLLDVAGIDGATDLPRVELISKDGVAVGVNDNPLPMLFMPAARAEFMLHAPTKPGHFVLKSRGHKTGLDGAGDVWPEANLLEIVVEGPPVASKDAIASVSAKAPLSAVRIPLSAMPAPRAAASHTLVAPGAEVDPCRFARLKKGEKRRFYLRQADSGGPVFYMAYEVVHADNKTTPVFPTRAWAMDAKRVDVCVAHGGEEIWEIINEAPELHNFHVHQMKFMVAGVDQTSPEGCKLVNLPNDGADHSKCEVTGVTGAAGHDTFPVPPNGGRLTIAAPFKNKSQIGQFVMHCHILEHEDHGMMATIRVK